MSWKERVDEVEMKKGVEEMGIKWMRWMGNGLKKNRAKMDERKKS